MTLNEKFHEFVRLENENWKVVFQQMAKYVFQYCHLETNGKTYYFTEIEFYYYSNEHPDPWCYRQPNKNKAFLPSDTLWFHYSGMDITFDNEEKDEYGGILIRGIQPEKGEPVNGPLRSLYKLLNTEPQSDTKPICLRLAYNEKRNLPKDIIKSEGRYGLNNASGEKKDYEKRTYRFYLEGVKIARNKTTPRI